MNVLRFEVKKLWLFTLFWSIGLVFGLLLYMAFFPTMAADPSAMNAILENFPGEFLSFFGLDSALPFNTILGYYALTISFIMGAIAIHASYLGLSILSIEERELTADFLMTRPISRQSLFIQKLGAACFHLGVVYIVINISSILSVMLFRSGQSVDYTKLLTFTTSLLFFQLFFLSLGILVSLVIPKFDNVVSYAMGIGFGLFIISSFGDMLSIDIVSYFTAYGYFNPNEVLVNGLSIISMLLNTLWIVITIGIAFKLYLTRNIHTV
ncbi:MAG: ABC transporter permease subunit [Candidatus Izemoplasma sp.]|nr:ABC transporter permease subunit [Candidatus Izemoplasma sp.]